MTKTYTDEEHRAIAEFAGWQPELRECPNEGWKFGGYEYDSDGTVIAADYICKSCEQGFSDMEHHDHEITPPPLDDALAMACLRKLGEATHFELSALDEWTVEVYDAKWKAFGASDPRTAIFMAVLAWRSELGITSS